MIFSAWSFLLFYFFLLVSFSLNTSQMSCWCKKLWWRTNWLALKSTYEVALLLLLTSLCCVACVLFFLFRTVFIWNWSNIGFDTSELFDSKIWTLKQKSSSNQICQNTFLQILFWAMNQHLTSYYLSKMWSMGWIISSNTRPNF